MQFEWDDSKKASNIRKHGIDFADAVGIFNHSMVETVDDRNGFGAMN